jgi:hypothetical protein
LDDQIEGYPPGQSLTDSDVESEDAYEERCLQRIQAHADKVSEASIANAKEADAMRMETDNLIRKSNRRTNLFLYLYGLGLQ